MRPLFITGIGTGIGKTIVSSIVTEALHADYWKPIQAGVADGTDNLIVQTLISNKTSIIHNELYKLRLAASPHIAAREEKIKIELTDIYEKYLQLTAGDSLLVIEGAGGIMVPLNENKFVIDLIKILNAKVILVSRNYLGSINHSLLTAEICKANNIDVSGWIFNDQYMDYEQEIVNWSGFPSIGSIPYAEKIDKEFICEQAEAIKKQLTAIL